MNNTYIFFIQDLGADGSTYCDWNEASSREEAERLLHEAIQMDSDTNPVGTYEIKQCIMVEGTGHQITTE